MQSWDVSDARCLARPTCTESIDFGGLQKVIKLSFRAETLEVRATQFSGPPTPMKKGVAALAEHCGGAEGKGHFTACHDCGPRPFFNLFLEKTKTPFALSFLFFIYLQEFKVSSIGIKSTPNVVVAFVSCREPRLCNYVPKRSGLSLPLPLSVCAARSEGTPFC